MGDVNHEVAEGADLRISTLMLVVVIVAQTVALIIERRRSAELVGQRDAAAAELGRRARRAVTQHRGRRTGLI